MIIGITGGIASGKTVISNYLASLGYPIVDADLLSRKIMEPGGEVLKQIAAHFGKEMILEDGSLNRTALAARIFSDVQARHQLDAITHPAIRALAQACFRALAKEPIIFFVVPLMYESGMDKLCDEIWLVLADESLRQKRLSERDGIDVSYANQKIASQLSDEERLSHHPIVLRNNGQIGDLYILVDNEIKKLKKYQKKG